jgi:hypothetical protein
MAENTSRGAGSRGAGAGRGGAKKSAGAARSKGRSAAPPADNGAADGQQAGRPRYHRPDTDYYRDEADRARKREGGFYDWKDGHNGIRILPPWGPEGRWSKLEMTHFQLPPDRAIARCLMTFADDNPDMTCPICDQLDMLAAEFGGEGVDFDRWYAGSKYLVNMLDIEKNDGVVLVARLPQKVYNWIVKQMDNPRLDDMLDPVTGLDMDVMKTGAKLKTDYTCTFLPDRMAIADTDEQVDEILDAMKDLNQVVKFPGDGELAKIESAAQRLDSYFRKRGDRPSQDAYDYRPRGQGGQPHGEDDIPVDPSGGRRPARGGRSPRSAAGGQDNRQPARSPRGGRTPTPRPQGPPPQAAPPGRREPECFGQWVDQSRKCQSCPMEYDCQDAQAQ